MFYTLRGTFNNIDDNEHRKFLNNSDQTLRNIALNLVENYKAQYEVCKTKNDYKECCNYLNKWLNEKRALYTSNAKCKSHNELWEHYIEGLWTKMQEHVEKEEEKCKRKVSGPDFFQDKWIISSCNNSQSIVIQDSCPEVAEPKEKECPPTIPPTSSSCKAVLTTTYVIFGILLFSMYLLRVLKKILYSILYIVFSSVGMKINNLIRGEKIKRRDADKENNESFRSYDNSNVESLDRRFNVIYNSFQN
ncbi:PIR protein [Plasmodium ovale]|uniref:PIR protein n=1 Tax=Plasmodium ovale TaxID=36330 RepID=A0A1D3JG52_PLAOA|nr:PIR protein [Plasmodium ovale]